MRHRDFRADSGDGGNAALAVARDLGVVDPGPVEVNLLKHTSKTLAVRLTGQDGRSVVLKRGSVGAVLREVEIYEHLREMGGALQPEMYVSVLRPEGGWMVLEDLGDVIPEVSDPDVRALVGGALGRLAASTNEGAQGEPTPGYSQEYFQVTAQATCDSLRVAAVAAGAGALGELLREACAVVSEAHRALDSWSDCFDPRPRVLCHGDVKAKNLRWSPGKKRMYLLDWEFSRFGPRAVDLGCIAQLDGQDPLLSAYVAEDGSSGAGLLKAVALGKLLRGIHGIHWAITEFHPESTRSVQRIGFYARAISGVLRMDLRELS